MSSPKRKDFVSGRWQPVRPDSPEPAIPGLLVRRSQQAHTALWAICVGGDITVRQFAILRVLAEEGKTDQTSLGRLAAIDRSNLAEVLSRLLRRRLVRRSSDPSDGRRNVWSLTASGHALFEKIQPSAAITTELLLAPLVQGERREFLRLLKIVVDEAEHRIQDHHAHE